MVTTTSIRERALKAANRLPVLSTVLQEVLGLFAQGDDLSVADLAAQVEQDVVIAGTILSLANSAMYGGHRKVSSLRQAIPRLGIEKTKNVLLGLSAVRSLEKSNPGDLLSQKRFNAHSLAGAMLSDMIARKAQSTDPEWAFMAGLLHDIGLLLMACALPDEFRIIISRQTGTDAGLIESERSVMGFTHFEIGADLISRWSCPAAVQRAILYSNTPGFMFKKPLPLGVVVKSATFLADTQSISIFDSVPNQSEIDELFELLGILKPEQFLAEFQADFRELQSVC